MNADVWLGDSLGEMAPYYGLSDVALLGGSFAPWAARTSSKPPPAAAP
jgi:3-deoxy-D-manno-octulosonic-acid transferase